MLLSALFLTTIAHAETYALAEAGITMELGPNWHMTRWSDWDFDARSADGSVILRVWYTAFQQPVNDETAKAWGAVYREKLETEDRAQDVQLSSSQVENAHGRPRARTEMSFRLSGGDTSAVMYIAAFATEGKVVHIATFGTRSHGQRALNYLEGVLEQTRVDKLPADVPTTIATLTGKGWSAPLPPGWRLPLPSEATDVATLVGRTPEKDPSLCVPAIHPYPNGTADLLLACPGLWAVGILDDDSFADQQELLKQSVFGEAAARVPDAEKVKLKDRVGIMMKPGDTLHFAVVPWKEGSVVTWAVGRDGSTDALDNDLKATVSGLSFDGGGLPEPAFGAVVMHTLSYRPFSLPVLCSGMACLGIFGGFASLIFRKPKSDAPSY